MKITVFFLGKGRNSCPDTCNASADVFLIKCKACIPNLTEAFKHFWRQYHEGGIIFLSN